MKAALLADVGKMVVRDVPDPSVPPSEVLIMVKAVGVCRIDLHLFRGDANYNLDSQGHPIPLAVQPQILGHEFSGEILELGSEVSDLKRSDRVLCDQGRNCISQNRWPRCPYCRSGDSRLCDHYGEHGVTGLPGAMADYIAMPAANCLKLPDGMPMELGALVEPLGRVIHASDRVDRSHSRYSFEGERRISNVLIYGAGPSGLLFLQYLRCVKHLEGLILVADVRERICTLPRNSAGLRLTSNVRTYWRRWLN